MKNRTIILMSITFLIPIFFVSGLELGDTNSDGNVDIVDALLIAQYYVGLNPQPFLEEAADVDCSGTIDIIDALFVAQLYVGLISEFPCPNPTPSPTPQPTPYPTPQEPENSRVYRTMDISEQPGVDLSQIFPPDPPKELPVKAGLRFNASVPMEEIEKNKSFDFDFKPQTDGRDFQVHINFKTCNMKLRQVSYNGTEINFHEITLNEKDAFTGGKEGTPGLPVFTKTVAIPIESGMSIRIIENMQKTITNAVLYPIQPGTEDQELEEPPFEMDEAYYEQDRFLPEQLASVHYDWFRGCRLAVIQVAMARYNPARKELHMYPQVTLDVHFDNTETRYIPDGRRSRYTDEVLSRLLLNYSLIEDFDVNAYLEKKYAPTPTPAPPGTRDVHLALPPCDLLIITPEEFLTAADTLADWKEDCGISTTRITLESIDYYFGGHTPTLIRELIESQYNSVSNDISYVLLLGDADDISPFYQTPGGDDCEHPTDLYYVEMDGSGLFPELAIGRLPADSVTEAERMVDRIIAYEQSPPFNSSFYRSVILAAKFEKMAMFEWIEDRGYILSAQQVYNFYNSLGYTITREYSSDSAIPLMYADWSPLPPDLLLPGFPWDGNSSDIIDELNTGTMLLAHRDHGSPNGFSSPSFGRGSLDYVDTGVYSPVVLSINCSSGHFDNETDGDVTTVQDCFSEKFMSINGGALAVFTASRSSPTNPNNTFLPFLNLYVYSEMAFGDALNMAKMIIFPFHMSKAQRMFELYHCFGDPTANMRTTNPPFPPQDLKPPDWSADMEYHPAEPIPPDEPAIGKYVWRSVPGPGILISLVADGEIAGQAVSDERGYAEIKVYDSLRTARILKVSCLTREYTYVFETNNRPTN